MNLWKWKFCINFGKNQNFGNFMRNVHIIIFETLYTPPILFPNSLAHSVWKILDFCTTQILCEINFWSFRRPKSCHLVNLSSSEFEFLWGYDINKFEIVSKVRLWACRIISSIVLTFSNQPNLISRKIWVAEKSWNFHTVQHLPVNLEDLWNETSNQGNIH